MQRSALQVFAVPIVLGVLSAIGLLAALLGDDGWDYVSWLALGIPCAVMAWFWFGAGRLFRRNQSNPAD
ncbi:MAG: hypothetical protein ACOY5F_01665 [Pseudomonadota bacterium]